MGLFDELGKAMKKVEEDVKKADLGQQFKDLGEGLNRAASSSASREPAVVPGSVPQQGTAASVTPAHGRTPHPGYSRITAWIRTRYQGKISCIRTPESQRTELEQVAAEACSGLSSRAKKGFLDYLKSQDYQQLLR